MPKERLKQKQIDEQLLHTDIFSFIGYHRSLTDNALLKEYSFPVSSFILVEVKTFSEPHGH